MVMLVRIAIAALLVIIGTTPRVTAQDAAAVIGAASKTMGVDNVSAIAYIGRARTGAFGQSKSIGDPMGAVNVTNITEYIRILDFSRPTAPTALVSRATGTAHLPTVPGGPIPVPGTLNQTITAAQAATSWAQALNLWTTPWGFLKLAAASNAKVAREGAQQAVSFSPPGFTSPSGSSYTVTGYINNQNLVTKVETRVDHAVAGDLLVEFEYSGYQNMNGIQVPTRVVQRQAGLLTFDMSIESATPNPPTLAEMLAPTPGAPLAPAAAQASAAAPPVERIGEGVFKIGGNYASLAVDMGDHVLVVEAGQSEARGAAVIAAARQAIPNKRVRYVVNSHPHFDHASGLAAAIAEGATILTHRNNEPVLERLLSGSRSLVGDSLSKVANRRTNVVESVGNRDVRKGTNGRIVELHHIPNEHSDGMLAILLPAEKVLWTADITVVNPNPIQLATLRAAVAALNRLKLDYDSWIPAHPPNPDRPLTKADVLAAAGTN
jgi:glyoxylase-like metal-dependent hydrolase (beta-lactamase superfamily II)